MNAETGIQIEIDEAKSTFLSLTDEAHAFTVRFGRPDLFPNWQARPLEM